MIKTLVMINGAEIIGRHVKTDEHNITIFKPRLVQATQQGAAQETTMQQDTTAAMDASSRCRVSVVLKLITFFVICANRPPGTAGKTSIRVSKSVFLRILIVYLSKGTNTAQRVIFKG